MPESGLKKKKFYNKPTGFQYLLSFFYIIEDQFLILKFNHHVDHSCAHRFNCTSNRGNHCCNQSDKSHTLQRKLDFTVNWLHIYGRQAAN